MLAVGELLVDLLGVEAEDVRHDRGYLRRVPDLQRIRVDGHGLLADRQLDPRAVVDRAAVRGQRDRLTVLALGHSA